MHTPEIVLVDASQMPPKIHYAGIFLDLSQNPNIKNISRHILANRIVHQHITLIYKPESSQPFLDLVGEMAIVKVVGYAASEENEGLQVEILSDNRQIREMVTKISVPHITLSISEDGKAKNTCNLPFEPILPFYVYGRFGIMWETGELT